MQRGFGTIRQLSTQYFILATFTATLITGSDPPNKVTSAPDVNYTSYQTYSIDHLLKHNEFDFNSTLFERRLIESAATNSTGPIKFHQELQEMIVRKRSSDFEYEKQLELQRKYNISDKPDSEHSITLSRLVLMYPQYYDFDSIPHYFGEKAEKADERCPLLYAVVPPIMRHPEFGGLIPKWKGGALDKLFIKNVMLIHLSWLTCASLERSTIKDLGKKLKKRMELSRLTDETRVNLLREKGIIDETLESNIEWVKRQNIPMLADMIMYLL